MMDEQIYHKIAAAAAAYGVNPRTIQKWKETGLPRRWQMDVWLKSREMRLGLTPEIIESVSIPRRNKE